MQDMLREQDKQRQFYGNGDDGISGRGGGDGSNGPDDEGFAGKFDEFVQVFLAILGIVLLVRVLPSFFCKIMLTALT